MLGEAGYQLARGVVPLAVIEDLRRFLAVAAENASASASQLLGLQPGERLIDAIARAEREGRLEGLPREARDSLAGQLPLDVRLSPVLWQVAKSAELQQLLRTVLGSMDLYMHMPPMARFVPPGHSTAAVPAHQDVSYNKHMTDFVTCWVPLVQIDDMCGGVGIYEHTNVPVEREPGKGDVFWLGEVNMGDRKPVNIAMQPGDALLFTKWTVHGSMPNLSDRTRFSLDLRFFGAQHRSSKHYLDMQRWMVIPPGEKDDHG